jgi:hypothetical protein
MESRGVLPGCEANASNSESLRWAGKKGHLEIVR